MPSSVHERRLDTNGHRAVIEDFDLNLLRHLAALLDARSVSGAAATLGLSQPSLSRSLATLRSTFGDPLLVRSGRSMLPTPRALELRSELEPLLRSIGLLVQPAHFDPATTERRFCLGMSDLIAPLILPRVVPTLAREAPGIELSIRATPTPTEDLLSGRLDAMAGSALEHSEFHRTSLRIRTGTWKVILGPKHPSYQEPLTNESWLHSHHVQVAPAGRYGRPGLVDDLVAGAGSSRRIVLELGHISALPEVLLATPWVCSLPAVIAEHIASDTTLEAAEHPFATELSGPILSLTWHQRLHADPGHRWLRSLLTG